MAVNLCLAGASSVAVASRVQSVYSMSSSDLKSPNSNIRPSAVPAINLAKELWCAAVLRSVTLLAYPNTCWCMAAVIVAAGTDAVASSLVVTPSNIPRLPYGAPLVLTVHGMVPSSWHQSTLTWLLAAAYFSNTSSKIFSHLVCEYSCVNVFKICYMLDSQFAYCIAFGFSFSKSKILWGTWIPHD